ncbi:MAG TPA: HD domain-containing phosphohydrolase, partial [Bryobacteraceae bacterium]|nr:HD domain-containing phosphohydrolase [Bryobacteraceae bacterium]
MHITTHESSAINELSSTQPAFLCEGFPHDAPADSCILIVDNQEINRRVLRGILKSSRYRILEATSAEDALAVLEREKVDLIIVDFVLPQISGPDLCRRLKSNRKTQFIPIVILTSVQGVENEINGMVSGADEFLTQPLHGDVVRTRIRAMLRNKAAVDSLEEAESILFALAQTIEHRDSYTAGHCQRLAAYSSAIGIAMGLPRTSIIALHRGGYLHDIGKIGVPDSILYKQGPLTAEEWEIMRTHTIRGEQICLAMKTLAPVLPIIRHHHEKYDGSGYPDGLRGKEIPLLARILQVSDIYDALTTARPYKPAFSSARAMAILEEECQ